MQHSPFKNLGKGFVTVVTMIAGELDYAGAFGLSYDVSEPEDEGRMYPKIAPFIWVLFIILIPILLNNMLVRYIHLEN
jgi:hypothetical protein